MTRTHVSLSAQADLFGRLYRKACKYVNNNEDIRHRHTLYSCTMYGIPTSQRIANLIVWFEQRNLHHLMATVYRSWWHDDNKIISGYPHIIGYTVSIDSEGEVVGGTVTIQEGHINDAPSDKLTEITL